MDVVFPLSPPLRVRFEQMPPQAARFFEAEYGRMRVSSSDDAPDLLVRFVESLPKRETWEYLGPDAVLADDSVVVSAGGAHARIELTDTGAVAATVECGMPIDTVRRQVVIAAIALLALERGAVVVHGSAAVHDGHGVILLGDGGAGKTSVLAGLVAAGHSYVADDQLLLTRDGRLTPFQGLLELRLDTLEHDRRLGELAGSTDWRQARLLRKLTRAGRWMFARIPLRFTSRIAGALGRLEENLSDLCFFVDARSAFETCESSVISMPLRVVFLTRGHPELVESAAPERVRLWLTYEVDTAYEPLMSMMVRAARNSDRWHTLHVQAVDRQKAVIDSVAGLPGTYLRIAPGPSVDRAVELIDLLAP